MAIGKARDLGINSTQKPKSFNRLNNNADFSNSATGTYTDGNGVAWKYVTFDAGDTLTITTAGLARILAVGGGARGDGVNTGSGGNVFDGSYIIPAASYTVTIGAGAGGSNSPGGQTSVGTFLGANGGRGLGTSAGAWAGTNGLASDITGTSVTYGRTLATAANRGDGGANNAISGRVVVAVRT
jgi:hypothetical protein